MNVDLVLQVSLHVYETVTCTLRELHVIDSNCKNERRFGDWKLVYIDFINTHQKCANRNMYVHVYYT